MDMETLRHTNEQLISTLEEVTRIQDEGRTKRREAEAKLTPNGVKMPRRSR